MKINGLYGQYQVNFHSSCNISIEMNGPCCLFAGESKTVQGRILLCFYKNRWQIVGNCQVFSFTCNEPGFFLLSEDHTKLIIDDMLQAWNYSTQSATVLEALQETSKNEIERELEALNNEIYRIQVALVEKQNRAVALSSVLKEPGLKKLCTVESLKNHNHKIRVNRADGTVAEVPAHRVNTRDVEVVLDGLTLSFDLGDVLLSISKLEPLQETWNLV